MFRKNHVRFLIGMIVPVLLCLVWGMVIKADETPPNRETLSLGGMFTDHAVLQRDQPLMIWGRALRNTAVSATLGQATLTTRSDEKGQWQVQFPAMPASGPMKLHVSDNRGESVVLNDILIGDVWICSGQSNMRWPVEKSLDAQKEIATANDGDIRLFLVKNNATQEATEEVQGKWDVLSPKAVAGFSAVGYFFARELRKELNVPIGLVQNAWGGAPVEAFISPRSLESNPDFHPILDRFQQQLANFEKDLAEYERIKDQPVAPGASKPRMPKGSKDPWAPMALWNGMVEPISPFPVKGVIWYQGESNVWRAYQYRKLLPTMIDDWRNLWGSDLPFLIVQLANLHAVQTDANKQSALAELREAQAMTVLQTPHTAIALAIDVGEADDIHPKNKQAVAHRLALAALGMVYRRDVVYQGPTYSGMKSENGRVRVTFQNTHGGLVVKGDKLTGFALADEKRKWYWANARMEADSVLLDSEQVPHPVAVRYGWGDNPPCSLYNGCGLPAVPFRTDDWPGATIKNQ